MMKTSLTNPKLFTAIFTLLISSTVVLSGCQSARNLLGNRDDGSLTYQQSTKLAPLELPVEQETAAFVPLYPTPELGENTLQLENEAGKQYRLPKPERAVPITAPTAE